jgi:hypothetical protein
MVPVALAALVSCDRDKAVLSGTPVDLRVV